MGDGGAGSEVPSVNEAYELMRYQALIAIIKSLTSASESVLIDQLGKGMKSAEVRSHIKDGILPYVYAAGFLSFAGREIDRDNLSKVIKAIGITPNNAFIDALHNAGIKSHLIYVYAFYFLVANGKETSEENMSAVISALGLQPDKNRISDIRGFLLLP